MNDLDWLTLNVFEEAAGEPQDGRAAVAKVTLNRAARHYQSDGTITGTILWPNAFSWVAFDMVNGHYTKVAFTRAEEEARALELFQRAKLHKLTWAACEDVASDVLDGSYLGGPDYQKLGPDALLYLNPAIIPHLPAWADPAKLIAVIGHHHFYHP